MKSCLICATITIIAMIIIAIIAMDALTYGGLWKNDTWQFIRKIIGNNWGNPD
jgi:hypothetical protein